MLKLLIIDNYDSFTYNIVQYFGELGADVEVFRNDDITLEQIAARKPDRLVISPGPCSPLEAGISVAATGGLPGPPVDWRGLWRQDRSGAAADARKNQRHHHIIPSHPARRVCRFTASVHG